MYGGENVNPGNLGRKKIETNNLAAQGLGKFIAMESRSNLPLLSL